LTASRCRAILAFRLPQRFGEGFRLKIRSIFNPFVFRLPLCFPVRQPETRFLVKSVAIDALCLRSTKKGNFPEVRRKSLAKYPQNAAKHAAC